MEIGTADLFHLQILAERAVKQNIEKMKDLENKLCQLCRVCGDRASGRHYGVPSCDGCRGFFKRSVRRNTSYHCKYNMNCVVDMKRRNQCQYCRFQRCARVGMNKHAVQHERLTRKMNYDNTTPQVFNPQIPGIMNFNNATIPSPSLFYFDALSPLSLPSPSMILSPPCVPSFSRFPLFHQPLLSPITNPDQFNDSPFKRQSTPATIAPIKITCPNSPLTPLSKRSSEYSIESLLKVSTVDRQKQAPLLTPPSSPQQPPDLQYNERVHEALLRILETTIARVHTIPAFQNLSNDFKSSVLEDSWMPVFLLGIHESGYPLERLVLYLQNVIKHSLGLHHYEGLVELDIAMKKLREYNVDPTELAYLRATTLFNSREESHAENLKRLHEEAKHMLIEYDSKTFPQHIARPCSLLAVMSHVEKIPNGLGKLFFPKLSDIKNLVHHIHTTIVNEHLRHATTA